MRGRFLAAAGRINCLVLAITLLLGNIGSARLQAADEPKLTSKEAADPFGLTEVWTVSLEIPAKEYEAMQPAAVAFPGPGAPPQQRAREEPATVSGTSSGL